MATRASSCLFLSCLFRYCSDFVSVYPRLSLRMALIGVWGCDSLAIGFCEALALNPGICMLGIIMMLGPRTWMYIHPLGSG